ncbi:MAG: hypothetical protein ACI9QD_000255 [Thermoproteota archaeon]|jgi:hypothetical protein
MLKLMLLLLLLLSSISSFAFDHSYSDFDTFLKQYVHPFEYSSKVDYKKIKTQTIKIDLISNFFEKLTAKEYKSFTKDQKLTYWINAYNFFTIKLVAKNYPVESIKDIRKILSGAFTPWKIDFINILGKEISLDRIEHKIIRKKFKEPRVHFALVCASGGCPPLMNFAFTAKKLEEQLKHVSQNFILDTNKNLLKRDTIMLSKIFKWYGNDFNKKYKSALHFIAQIITKDTGIQKRITTEKIKVDYLDYDWKLNDYLRKNAP